MAELPGHKKGWNRLTSTSAAYDIVLAPLAIIGAGVSSYAFFWNHQFIRGGITFGAALVVMSLGLLKAGISFKEQLKKTGTHELEGCLHTLHAILIESLEEEAPDPRLRITIHRPVEDGQRLEQITDYVGAARSRSGTAGRKFAAQSGIIGLALQKPARIVGSRENDDYEAYIEELKTIWHYTEHDARNLNPASMSWMAIPLVEQVDRTAVVRGIVYFDSTDRVFFTDERAVIAESACVGIARFIKQRYT